MTEQAQTRTALSLPKTRSELLDHKKSNKTKTLNDMVEELYLDLYEDDRFQRLLDAVYPEDAVEGDLKIDDALAATMIRDKAVKRGNSYVAEKKLGTIVKALYVVQRRYEQSRSERRRKFGGAAPTTDDATE